MPYKGVFWVDIDAGGTGNHGEKYRRVEVLNEAEGKVWHLGNAVTGMSQQTRVSGPMCL